MDYKKILFVIETTTLAHIARCVSLAKQLRSTGRYEIALAFDDNYDNLLGDLPFQRFFLYSISNSSFIQKLKSGSPLYNTSTLTRYVEDELKIMEQFKPDFIIGDFRLSLNISCTLKKTPYAMITNAYWSPYSTVKFTVPDLPITKLLGPFISQKIFDLFRPLSFAFHTLPCNKARKKFGLPFLSWDLRQVYCHADFTFYADIEGIIPMRPHPKNHLFIGPILWSASAELPHWWETIPKDNPIVFVTLGSSGDHVHLPIILNALSTMPVTVIAVTAGKSNLKSKYSNVFIADFLPAKQAVQLADIIICNGGSPMVYQTLCENKSLIGIPENLDQHLMMETIVSAGLGECIRSGQLSIELIQKCIHLLLKKTNQASMAIESTSKNIALDKIDRLIQSACGKSSTQTLSSMPTLGDNLEHSSIK